MSYEPLTKLFYSDTSSDRFGRNERLAAERLNADSSFRTGIVSPSGELFLAVPRELSVLNERVLRMERKVSASMRALPPVARGALIRSLVMDEVVCTNELEGIHSTRRQISDILKAEETTDEPAGARRFRELAKMYLGLSEAEVFFPTSAEDVRSIYDRVMLDEPMDELLVPDGKVFRRGEVEVIGEGSKVLHQGLYPEEKILDAIERMLALVNSQDIPETYSAIMSHYIFEYVHPFYDGNGRTGRYLLALHLSRPLSVLTSLSLSRVIAENRGAYYKSFRDVEQRLNHGELTFFVMNILNNVQVAQNEVILSLSEKIEQLDALNERLEALESSEGLRHAETNAIYMLAQLQLFASFPDAALGELAAHLNLGRQQARKHLKGLEDRGYVSILSRRPLRFAMSDRLCAILGLD